jgi:hypothetical protein
MKLSHQPVWISLGATAVLAGIGWWLATHHREVVLETRLPKDLLVDPWTASRQFLSAMGMEPEKSTRLDDILDKADENDVVILDLDGPSPDKAQLARLRSWVRDGGRLIVEINHTEEMTRCILPKWGLQYSDSSRTPGTEECDEFGYGSWTDRPAKQKTWMESEDDGATDGTDDQSSMDSDDSDELDSVLVSQSDSVSWNPPSATPAAWSTVRPKDMDSTWVRDSLRKMVATGDTTQYRLSTYANGSLAWSASPPREAYRDPGGFVLIGSLHEGTIVVVEDFMPFRYGHLAEWDHAALLARLADPARSGTGLWIARRARLEGWLSMLGSRMPLALSLAFVALALAMWTAASRFGPILVSQAEEKTGIIDHAEGAGRWFWQFPGGRTRLLAALRESARRKQLRTHPELVGADPKTVGKTLAADGLGDANALQEAFDPTTEPTQKQFLSVAKTLWSLRRNR